MTIDQTASNASTFNYTNEYEAPPAPPTDTQEERALYTASFSSRFIGRFVDGIANVLFAVITMVATTAWKSAIDGVGVQLAATLAILFVPVLPEAMMTASESGQSIGKRVAGTRVVRCDGTRVSFARSLVRASFGNVLAFVFAFLGTLLGAGSSIVAIAPLALCVVEIALILGEQSRRLADRVAGTRVVTKETLGI